MDCWTNELENKKVSECAGFCKCGERYSRDSLGFDEETGNFGCNSCGRSIDIIELVTELADGLCRANDELIEIRGACNLDLYEKMAKVEERVEKMSKRIDDTVVKLSGNIIEDKTEE